MKSDKSSPTFQCLYNTSVTPDKAKEMTFNLVNYIELLIDMDKQNKEWLNDQKMIKEEGRYRGEKLVETDENPSQEDI